MKSFKGKRIDTNAWVEGSLYTIDEKFLILPESLEDTYDAAQNLLTATAYEVDAKTLCAYVADTSDCNDNIISVWENDVYKIESYEKEFIALVEQGMGEFTFTVTPVNENESGVAYSLYQVAVLEYLGNIIDNPELMPDINC